MNTETERDADLLELRATVRRLLERQAGQAPAGAIGWSPSPQTPAGEYDPQLWKLLAEQVGVAGLAVPERFGGSGCGYRECHLVLEELGREAVASPFLATAVLATQALLLAGDEDATGGLLAGLAGGTRTAALVSGTGSALTATPEGDSWVIDGTARPVLDGARADLLFAFAELQSGQKSQPQLEPHSRSQPHAQPQPEPRPPGETGPALFLLDVAQAGLRRDLLPTMDQSLHLAELRCQAVPARRLSAPHAADRVRSAQSRLTDLAATAITAEQVGGARRCLELTVEYARTRVQFGRPIGGFQAIKHRLADLLVLVESADSASQAAAAAWADDEDDAPLLASLAKSYCSEAYRAVAAETIQLHGGIGFTWEHRAHRYFKRAHSTSTLFGDPAWHRARLAERLGWLDLAAHPDGNSLP